jgi:DNA polymerase III alpha subunit (gram-positive type)
MNNTFFIDFETTGLNPYHDEIIEFAIKKYNDVSHIQSLVKPNKTFLIPPKITQITGITTKMIFEGQDVVDSISATEMMFNYINNTYDGNGKIYLIAHNGIPFDFVYLKTLIKSYCIHKNMAPKDIPLFRNYDNIVFMDSLDIARSFVPHLYSYSQKNLCKIFNIVQNNAHRALGDVEDLEKVYYTIVNYGIGKFKYDKDLLQNPQKIFDRIYNIYS